MLYVCTYKCVQYLRDKLASSSDAAILFDSCISTTLLCLSGVGSRE